MTATMELPTEDYVPKFEGVPKDLTMVLFGPPKVGKTTFGASFPKSLLVECEPGGAKYIRCRKVDVEHMNQLKDIWMALREDTEYETVVIDSLDRVAQWIEAEVCNEVGINNILGNKKGSKHGEQWGIYVQKVLMFLEAWKKLGKRVVFLAHTKKAEMSGDGLVINPKTINLYGQAANRVISIVDNIGHLYAAENDQGKVVRVLSFSPGTHVEAGARDPHLSGKMIEIPEKDPYGAFAALFGSKPPLPPKAALPDEDTGPKGKASPTPRTRRKK